MIEAVDNDSEELLAELTARAWALGYRLIKRTDDYLLLGVHQPRPLPVTYSAMTLKGHGDIADMVEGFAKLPRYCLQLQDNPRVEVVPQANGRRIVKDTTTGEYFTLRPGEHEDESRLIVYARYPPPIGNWSRC